MQEIIWSQDQLEHMKWDATRNTKSWGFASEMDEHLRDIN